MAHLPSDIVSNQLQWSMPHNVASFSRLATTNRMPITVLGFMFVSFLNADKLNISECKGKAVDGKLQISGIFCASL